MWSIDRPTMNDMELIWLQIVDRVNAKNYTEWFYENDIFAWWHLSFFCIKKVLQNKILHTVVTGLPVCDLSLEKVNNKLSHVLFIKSRFIFCVIQCSRVDGKKKSASAWYIRPVCLITDTVLSACQILLFWHKSTTSLGCQLREKNIRSLTAVIICVRCGCNHRH